MAINKGKQLYDHYIMIHSEKYTFGFLPSLWTSPGGSAGKESTCNAGDLGLIPGLGRSPGEGKGSPNPVFWPREFHGLYSPWGCKESDKIERLSLSLHYGAELRKSLEFPEP